MRELLQRARQQDVRLLSNLVTMKTLIASAFVLASMIALVALLDNSSFGPVDTHPRLYKTARCSDSEWALVAVYREKHHWFSNDTDIWVKIFDSRGKVVHGERLYQFDTWEDVEGYMRGDSPAGFCNKALIMKKA
jgi:hypothetical protein